jgi:hypothetical protein
VGNFIKGQVESRNEVRWLKRTKLIPSEEPKKRLRRQGRQKLRRREDKNLGDREEKSLDDGEEKS